MKYLEARLNIDLIDKTSDFTYIDGTDAYIMGENQQKKALYCILLSVIGLFGMFVTELWRIEDGFF